MSEPTTRILPADTDLLNVWSALVPFYPELSADTLPTELRADPVIAEMLSLFQQITERVREPLGWTIIPLDPPTDAGRLRCALGVELPAWGRILNLSEVASRIVNAADDAERTHHQQRFQLFLDTLIH